MKYSYIAILIAIASTTTHAAQTGIGVSVQGDAGTIYVPVEISDAFRIEPTFEFRHNNEEQVDGDTYSMTNMKLGCGLFGKTELLEQLRTYYGVRLGYVYTQRERSAGVSSDYDVQTHGINVAPTLGLEFYITDRFSVGGEIAWYFQYDHGAGDGDFGVDNETTTGTDSRLVARFYF